MPLCTWFEFLLEVLVRCQLIKLVAETFRFFLRFVTGQGVEEEISKEICGVVPVLKQNRQTRFRKRAPLLEEACIRRLYTQSLVFDDI
jgi:hypothetical protein